jgi:hypothetical protein
MNKQLLRLAIFLITLFVFTSCEEKITYGWGDINESLGQLQKARNELKSEISNLEYEGYDTSSLEDIDNRLKKVENILDEHFN